jgi:hypothetical protein
MISDNVPSPLPKTYVQRQRTIDIADSMDVITANWNGTLPAAAFTA